MMEFKVVDYTTPKSILFVANAPRADFHVTFLKGSSLAQDVNGRKIVKAGTVYPANDSTAVGVVAEDYDVTDGDKAGAVIYIGSIDKNKMPEVPTAEALTAMKGLFFMPFNYTVATKVKLNKNSLSFSSGDAQTLTATVEGFGVEEESPVYTWRSSDESVATVSNGTVTPVGTGVAIVTCSTIINGKEVEAECKVISTYTA